MRLSVLLVMVTVPLRLAAQDEVPRIIHQGIDLMRSDNCAEAFDLWIGHWPDPQKSQMADSCSVLQENGGTLHGYDVLKVVTLTPHVSRVYLVLLYQKQPIYFMLLSYKPEQAWTVNTINWNTDPDKVIPKDLLPPMRPE
jgi:hypothetical protein